MRLVSFGQSGQERCGILHGESIIPVEEISPELAECDIRQLLSQNALGELESRFSLMGDGLGLPLASTRLGPPIANPSKIICIGKNYHAHAAETGSEAPPAPLLFCKSPSSLIGPRDTIELPIDGGKVDFEVELAVVIGRTCKHVAVDQAMSVIAGYMVANDVTARAWQKGDGQWFRGKSCDTFFPCGPAFVTKDEVPDYRRLELRTVIGDEIFQQDRADLLIHDIPHLIAYVSRYQTLLPGDIISTGTPAGVGCYREPPRFLQPGDVVSCSVESLGALVNPVAAEVVPEA